MSIGSRYYKWKIKKKAGLKYFVFFFFFLIFNIIWMNYIFGSNTNINLAISITIIFLHASALLVRETDQLWILV